MLGCNRAMTCISRCKNVQDHLCASWDGDALCTSATHQLHCFLFMAAAGLLVAGFRRFRAQRGVLMEEVLTALLPNLSLSRGHTPRRFLVGDSGATCIHVASALFLQMLQVQLLMLSSPAFPLHVCLVQLPPSWLPPLSIVTGQVLCFAMLILQSCGQLLHSFVVLGSRVPASTKRQVFELQQASQLKAFVGCWACQAWFTQR